MKRWPIVAGTITGGVVGFLSVVYVSMALALHTSLTTTGTIILITICPVIYSLWGGWWLVPILNAILYGGIVFAISKWRNAHKLKAGISK